MTSTESREELEIRVVIGSAKESRRALASGRNVVVGSGANADLRVNDDGVNDRHLTIQVDKGGRPSFRAVGPAVVRHNGVRSATGTLRHGDSIEIGSAVLRVLDPKKPSAEAAASALSGEELVNVATTLSRVAAQGISVPSESEKKEMEHHARRAGIWWRMHEMPPLELQHVWFDLNRRDDWRSLAVVPVGNRAPALAAAHAFARMASLSPAARVLVVDATPGSATSRGDPVVSSMADAVRRFPGASFDFLDATALGLNESELSHIYVPQLLNYIASDGGRYNKVIIALGNLLANAQSIPIARAVDTVLLAVEVGLARTHEVRRVVDIIGQPRVRGAVAIEHV